jgi:HEAT repeat protein
MIRSKQAQHLLETNNFAGLVELLRRGTRSERRDSVWALGELGDRRAVEPLSEALHNALRDDEDLPLAVVEALGTLHSPAAVEALKACLDDRRDDRFYFLAHREALFAIAEEDDLATLQGIAEDSSRDRDLRREAKNLIRRRTHRS